MIVDGMFQTLHFPAIDDQIKNMEMQKGLIEPRLQYTSELAGIAQVIVNSNRKFYFILMYGMTNNNSYFVRCLPRAHKNHLVCMGFFFVFHNHLLNPVIPGSERRDRNYGGV